MDSLIIFSPGAWTPCGSPGHKYPRWRRSASSASSLTCILDLQLPRPSSGWLPGLLSHSTGTAPPLPGRWRGLPPYPSTSLIVAIATSQNRYSLYYPVYRLAASPRGGENRSLHAWAAQVRCCVGHAPTHLKQIFFPMFRQIDELRKIVTHFLTGNLAKTGNNLNILRKNV